MNKNNSAKVYWQIENTSKEKEHYTSVEWLNGYKNLSCEYYSNAEQRKINNIILKEKI